MSFDAHSNFGYSTVASAPSPATTATSLVVADASVFPAAPFNCTVWPAGVNPLSSNAEIVRVTAILGTIFTIVRAQEGTTAQSIADGWQIANTTSVKVFTDIENSIILSVSAGGNSAGAPAISIADANGVSFGLAGNTLTASIATAAGGVAVSAGANSQSTGTVVFSNSNNVSFGMNAGGIMTGSASFNGLTSQSAQAASASNGSFAFQTLGFSNANNVTFGTSAGSIVTASVAAGAAQGSISAGANSVALGQVVFSNSNNVTFGLNGSTVTASASAAAQSTQPVAASASNGSFLFSTLGFSNGNGVTFGTSAGSIISASVAAGVAAGSISAGANSVVLGQAVFSNSNGVSFGLNGSTITASVAAGVGPGSVSAGTTNVALGQVVFSNSNNFSFGLDGSTLTAIGGGIIASFFQPRIPVNPGTLFGQGVSTNNFVGFDLPYALSADYVRIPMSFSQNQAITLSTLASSMNASVEIYSTFQAVFYSLGTGASSNSLMSVALASAPWTIRNSLSVATNGTQGSYTQALTGAASGSSITHSTQYSVSNTVYSVASATFFSSFSGFRYVDLNFATSLSAGRYWMGVGLATSSSSNSARLSMATVCNISLSAIYMDKATQNMFGPAMGVTKSLDGWQFGGFQISSANQGSISGADLSLAVVNASMFAPIFQIVRQA